MNTIMYVGQKFTVKEVVSVPLGAHVDEPCERYKT